MADSKTKSFSAKAWIFAGFITVCVLVAAFGGCRALDGFGDTEHAIPLYLPYRL